ncbi:MAG: hypothetical protein ACKO23_03345, partial [Gemmataceae bacterium]
MRQAIKRSWHPELGLALAFILGSVWAAEKTERFDKDPKWEGHQNRSTAFGPRLVKQDFGYSKTAHAGGKPGEIGGTITPDAEPAYYARKIPKKNLRDPLT